MKNPRKNNPPAPVVAQIAVIAPVQLSFDASTEGKEKKAFHYQMSLPGALVANIREMFQIAQKLERMTEELAAETIETFWDPSDLVGTGKNAATLRKSMREATDPNGVRYWSLACAALQEVHPEAAAITTLRAQLAEAVAAKDAYEVDNKKLAINGREEKRRTACVQRLDAMLKVYAEAHKDKAAATDEREKLTARAVIELAIAEFNERATSGDISKIAAEKALLLRGVGALREVLANTYRSQSSIFEAPTSVKHTISDTEPLPAVV